MSEEDLRIEESRVITDKLKIDECLCLTGTVQMFRMIAYEAEDIFYVAHMLNGQEPKGKYFTNIGSAKFYYEILKHKII